MAFHAPHPHLRGLATITNLNGGNAPSLNETFDMGFTNSTDSTLDSSPDAASTAGDIFAYGSGFLFLLMIAWCTRSRVPGEEYRRNPVFRRRFEERRRRQRERRERLEDPELRRTLMAKALATAKIKSYNSTTKQLTLGRIDGSVESCQDQPMESDESSTCVICLDVFQVGDTVAWSNGTAANSSDSGEEICRHVFHEDCISGWLARHEDCPSCRLTLLKLPKLADDDSEDGSLVSETDLETLDDEEDRRGSEWDTSAFVIVQGLVSRVRRASMSLVGQTIEAAGGFSTAPSPLRRVLSTGCGLTSKKTAIKRLSVPTRQSKQTARTIGSLAAVPMRRVKSIGPGSPVRRLKDDDYEYDDETLDDLPTFDPHSVTPPIRALGIPFRRTSSTGIRSVASVPEEPEDLTEDYEDDLMVRTMSPALLGERSEEEESDDNTVPQRNVHPFFIPFRRVMSSQGTYAALTATTSTGENSNDSGDATTGVKASVSWRDSRLAISKSQDEEEWDEQEDDLLRPIV